MKTLHVLLLVFGLLAARSVFAQQNPRPEDAPRQTLPTPPLLPATEAGPAHTPAPAAAAKALPADASPRGVVIPRQQDGGGRGLGFFPGVLGGLAGGLAGAGIGALAGHLVVSPTVGCDDEQCSGARLGGALVGAMVGVPAGTYLAGRWVGARGTYVYAMIGSLMGGVLASVGTGLIADNGVPAWKVPLLAGVLTLPAVGATLLYGYSHDLAAPQDLDFRPGGRGASPMGRLGLETLFGGFSGLVLGAVGYVGGFAAGGCSFPDGCNTEGDTIVANSVFIATYALGTSLGVYAAGLQTGGYGSFVPAFAGSALGAAAGSAAVFLDKDAWILGMVAGSLVGAVVGYEVSHAAAEFGPGPAYTLRPMTGVQVVPVIAAVPTGGILGGLAGRF